MGKKWAFFKQKPAFIKRLDYVLSLFPDVDWEAPNPNATVKEENERRIRLRKKLLKPGLLSEKIPRRWIPAVRELDGELVEQALSREVIDPGISSGEEVTRSNIIKFCASLYLNGEELSQVFYKVFFTNQLNLKNHFELVCQFYIQNPNERNWYKKATAFLEKYDLVSIPEQVFTDQVFTDEIPLDDLCSEEELASYIKFNLHTFTERNQFVSCRDGFEIYLLEAWEKAVQEVENPPEFTGYFQYLADRNIQLTEEVEFTKLIQIILNLAISDDCPVAKFDLPERVRKNFPTGSILQGIVNQTETSMDRLRKAAILLYFYLEESREEIDNRLKFVNMQKLCEFDPFDAMIIHCCDSKKPLKTLREIMLAAKPEGKKKNV